MFQPSPLESTQALETYDGEDPLNPGRTLATPRAMADRYIQLYSNAVDMHAMLQQECSYALLLMDLLDAHFHKLGTQVIDELCRTGVMLEGGGHKKYRPSELTLPLIGTHASAIW